MKHISIEGNIGVGKSTVLDYIDQIILDRGESVFVDEGHLSTIREPVEMWTRPVTDDGKSKLELLYEDPKNQTANFQRGVLEDLPRAIQQGYDCTLGSSSIVTERSVGSSLRVFSAVHLDPKYGNITSKDFIELLDYFYLGDAHKYMPDAVVYLRSTPELCYQRIKKRSRLGEATISLEYLQDLHKAHEEWIGCYNMNDVDAVEAEYRKVCKNRWVEPLILDVTTEEYNTVEKVALAVLTYVSFCNSKKSADTKRVLDL